jgi:hypothetical protein
MTNIYNLLISLYSALDQLTTGYYPAPLPECMAEHGVSEQFCGFSSIKITRTAQSHDTLEEN